MAFLGWYGKASPQQRNDAIKQIILYGIGAALLLLVVTGRIPWLFAIISAIIPFWRKILAARNLLGLAQRFTGKQFTPSRFTTQWLVLNFDIINRAIDGEVRIGELAGNKLSELNEAQINSLLAACQADRQSVAAIHAFLRARNAGWEQNAQHANKQPPPQYSDVKLSREQALEILGLDTSATENEINKAHKRLMQKLHPDRGGSSYLATQINLAKDTLLNS